MQPWQPAEELAPVSVYLPGAQSEHSEKPPSFSSLYLPGLHALHAEEPGLLRPVPQEVHASAAPMLKVSAGHFSSAVLRAFVLRPALAVEQKADPVDEKVPVAHGVQSVLVPSPDVPAGHGVQSASKVGVQGEEMKKPTVHTRQEVQEDCPVLVWKLVEGGHGVEVPAVHALPAGHGSVVERVTLGAVRGAVK